MSTSKTSSKPSYDERVHKRTADIMSHIKGLRAMMNYQSAYLFGGTHRVWVMRHAKAVVDDYTASITTFAGVAGMPLHGTVVMEGDVVSVITPHYSKLKLTVPEPPCWGGERPEWAQCGYTGTSAFKDALHYERSIRKFFADQFLYADTDISPDKKIVYVKVYSPKTLIYMGGDKRSTTEEEWAKDAKGTTVPLPPYDDTVLEGTGVVRHDE